LPMPFRPSSTNRSPYLRASWWMSGRQWVGNCVSTSAPRMARGRVMLAGPY